MHSHPGPVHQQAHGRLVEVESLADLETLLAAGARSMSGWRLQSLDLTGHSAALRSLDPAGALFLGCRMSEADEDSVRDRGALVFPALPDVPFDAYRTGLYTAEELYAGLAGGYAATPDARIYAWSRQPATALDVAATLAQALHDHAVDDALDEAVAGRSVVGVMGGHAVARDTAAYADAARLGRTLALAGHTVATGGGPGAMEAANLGARLAALPPAALEDALARVAAVPDFRPSVTAWADLALSVLADHPGHTETLGIPTWFYGHEPPNPFATAIAKYFRNSLREDVLLRVCVGGIVFLPGSAGTVQEIFTDACENYYADAATRTPMVLVGRRHWTDTLPAWPLLSALAEQRGFADRVFLADDVDEVCGMLGS